jgi:biotin synthase
MKVCCGGILGLGESEGDRVDMLVTLADLPEVNSIFVGDTLLTAGNPEADKDRMLFDRLGLEPL